MRIMANWLGLAGAAMVLGGCTELMTSTERANYQVRKSIYESAEKVQKYVRYQPPTNIKQAPQTAFCYKVPGDVICYDSPKPYISNRLVGYQGYTAAAVPATVHFAPRNASVVSDVVRADRVATNTVATAPIETVVVDTKIPEETSTAKSKKEPEKDPGNPKSLMPRF